MSITCCLLADLNFASFILIIILFKLTESCMLSEKKLRCQVSNVHACAYVTKVVCNLGPNTSEIVTTRASTWSHELSSLEHQHSSPNQPCRYTHPQKKKYCSCICIITVHLASHIHLRHNGNRSRMHMIRSVCKQL